MPMPWTLVSKGRRVCVRVQPTKGDVQPRWSHPVSHSFPVGQPREVVLPVQPPGKEQACHLLFDLHRRGLQQGCAFDFELPWHL